MSSWSVGALEPVYVWEGKTWPPASPVDGANLQITGTVIHHFEMTVRKGGELVSTLLGVLAAGEIAACLPSPCFLPQPLTTERPSAR